MRTSPLLVTTVGAAALLLVAPGCRKKAAPPEVAEVTPPPPPPTPPEPQPPPCPTRTSMLGTWFLVTQVSDDVGGKLAGVNGYYTVRVHPVEDETSCDTKLVVSKDGWGRGANTNEQRLFGNTTVPEGGGYWKMPLELGMGDEKTDIVFFVKQDDKTLSGYWHYMGASWGRSPVYGIVEGRKEKWEGKAGAAPEMHEALSRCGLAGLPSTDANTCSGF